MGYIKIYNRDIREVRGALVIRWDDAVPKKSG